MDETTLTLDEIKMYCRIDGDDEKTLLEMLKGASEEYLKSAGIAVDYKNLTYKLTILALIRYYYDERISSGAPKECTDAIVQLQLKSGGNDDEVTIE